MIRLDEKFFEMYLLIFQIYLYLLYFSTIGVDRNEIMIFSNNNNKKKRKNYSLINTSAQTSYDSCKPCPTPDKMKMTVTKVAIKIIIIKNKLIKQ